MSFSFTVAIVLAASGVFDLVVPDSLLNDMNDWIWFELRTMGDLQLSRSLISLSPSRDVD